jgi:two-component system CitB family response regulator
MIVDNLIDVLIIEDDLRIADIQKRFIEQLNGFQTVGIATNYSEAKTQIDILKPNLLLLDMYFPDMNGTDLLKEIKQQDKQMTVIMITASKEIEKVQEAISIGVFDFIIKPVLFERFKQSLERYRDYYIKINDLKKDNQNVSQLQVDQLLYKQTVFAENMNLPKGIDKLTLVKIIEVVRAENTGLTAETMARKIGVSRTTARRYLEHLISEGKIEADLSYGTIGRPERVYVLKE